MLPSDVASAPMVLGVHVPAEFALGAAFGRTPTDLPLHSLHPNGSLWDTVARRLVYSGVYRLDDTLSPVPDLAEAPCAVSPDLIVITCRLRQAAFHDGTPVTADDVAFTYELMWSEECRLPRCQTFGAPRDLGTATVVDERTVEFRLPQPDPAFTTTTLPDLVIEPRAQVEATFSAFVEASSGTDVAALDARRSSLKDVLHPVEQEGCNEPAESDLRDAELAIDELGVARHSREHYAVGAGGAFDACAYGEYLLRTMTDAVAGLSLRGTDAIAAAYPILQFPVTPTGSGPWRVVAIEPGARLQLEGFDMFYRGPPATKNLEVRLIRSNAEAIEGIRTGGIDWLIQPFAAGDTAIADGVGEAPGVAWFEYDALAFFALHYNLRPGMLFADPNLREAMERCINKEETVATVTAGDGIPVYSPISPSTWAYEPALSPPTRDTNTSRSLIERSGWTTGDDGVYRQGDRRLSATVPLWEDRPDFLAFVELVAVQVADCGIELLPQPMSFEDLITTIEWPLHLPGLDQPWDVVMSGWSGLGQDPDVASIFHSSAVVTEDNPKGFNFMGYDSDPADALLERARATYDPPQRARLYRDFQRLVAADRPMLFGWAPLQRDPASDRLRSTQGPLPTGTSTWWWQLETLYVEIASP